MYVHFVLEKIEKVKKKQKLLLLKVFTNHPNGKKYVKWNRKLIFTYHYIGFRYIPRYILTADILKSILTSLWQCFSNCAIKIFVCDLCMYVCVHA